MSRSLSAWLFVIAALLFAACDSGEEDPFEDDPTTGVIADDNIRIVQAPQSVGINDDIQNDDTAYLFLEQGGLTLAGPLTVDITAPGSYDSAGELTTGVIPAGTRVNSYYIDYDPSSRGIGLQAQVMFPNEILGIITLTRTLDDSDALLAVSTISYSPGADRGFDFNAGTGDSLVLGTDRRTVNINFFVDGKADQLRVITRPE